MGPLRLQTVQNDRSPRRPQDLPDSWGASPPAYRSSVRAGRAAWRAGIRCGCRRPSGHTVMVPSTIRLVERVRDFRRLSGGAYESGRRFLDFEVNGKSLYDELRGRGFDHIGAIWLDPRVEGSAAAIVARLMGEASPDLPPDRVAVFVCPECGDLGCGAVTVRLSVGPGAVTWSDWAWQTDYDPEPVRHDLDDMPSLSFDRAVHDAALRSAAGA